MQSAGEGKMRALMVHSFLAVSGPVPVQVGTGRLTDPSLSERSESIAVTGIEAY